MSKTVCLCFLIFLTFILKSSENDLKKILGPYKLHINNLETCQGPKSKNLVKNWIYLKKSNDQYPSVMVVNTTVSTPCKIEILNIVMSYLNETSRRKEPAWRYRLDKPLEHIVIGPLISQIWNITDANLKPGAYVTEVNLVELCEKMYPGPMPYGIFKSKSVLYSQKGNIACIVVNMSIRPKGNYHFAKTASQQLIAVSKVEINENFINTDDLSSCLNLKHSSLGIVVDAKCLGFEEVMNFASSKMMFDSIHKWLLIDDDNEKLNKVIDYQNGTEINFNVENKEIYNISDTLAVIENLNTSVDSDIIIGIRKDFYFDLLEAFNFGKIQGGNLTNQYVGSWNNDTGLLMAKNINTYKYYYRWNFQKWAMRMIVVSTIPPEQFRPEMITGRVLAPGVPRITQTCAMVLHAIADIHNFKFIYTIGDRWIGTYDTKNTMVVASSLYFGYQDISPVIRISSYIWGKIDIVHPPLTSLETRYYYRIPTKGPGKIENQFLRPLTTGAWLSVIALTVTCAVSLLVAAKLEQRPKPAQYAAFSVIASFCQQFFDDCGDNDTRRVSQARRIAIFVTGLSCVLIYNYYTSSVVSWLLNGPPPSINSLQELLDSPLELIYEDIGYARTWMQTPSYYYNKKNAKVEDEMRRKKVFNKKKDDPLFLPTDEGIEMVKAGGYAYHTQVDTANVLISRKFNQMELCELGSLQSMEKTLLFPAIQKNSPYKEFLVWSVARLSERGVVSCIQRRTTSESVSCEGSSPRALALGGAAPAFLLLAFGYLLATFIMFFERFVHKHGGLKKEQCRLRFLGDFCSGSIRQ